MVRKIIFLFFSCYFLLTAWRAEASLSVSPNPCNARGGTSCSVNVSAQIGSYDYVWSGCHSQNGIFTGCMWASVYPPYDRSFSGSYQISCGSSYVFWNAAGCGGQCWQSDYSSTVTAYNCCTPTTCAAQGKNCGTISNGCGGTLNCGTCSGSDMCTNNVCTSACGTGGCGTVTAGAGPGVVMYNGALITNADRTLTDTKISSRKWRVQTSQNAILNKYTYQYFKDWLLPKVPAGNRKTAVSIMAFGDLAANSGVNYFYADGDLLINQNLDLNSENDVVILVEGDLNINNRIRRINKKMFLGFYVKGKITVPATVNEIDGFYFSEGVMEVLGSGGTDGQLVGNGIFTARSGFNFTRSLGATNNQTTPAEKFVFDPSLIINAPTDLTRATYGWKEVKP